MAGGTSRKLETVWEMPLSTVRPPYSTGPSAEKDWVAFLPKYVLPPLVEPYLPIQSRPPGRPHKHCCPFKKEKILLINKCPNLKAELVPLDSQETGGAFRHYARSNLNPGITPDGPYSPGLSRALGLGSEGQEEAGGGTWGV